MAGFEYNATPYSLRRAYANVLYANVSAEDRRFLMGHKTNSDIYSHYHSAISTVSMQEIFRNARAVYTGEMHGLSLNRIKEMPQHISKEGWQKVQQDPEVVREVLETSRATSELQNLYGSVSAAVRACDPRIEDLVKATARLKNRRRVLFGIIYREEYRMAFVGRHCQQPAELHCSESKSISGHDDQEVTFIQTLEVMPGEQAARPLDNNDMMDAVREESISTYCYPEPPSISVDDTTLDDASGWILEVAREEEAVLLLDDRDTIYDIDSYSSDSDAAAEDQGPWTAVDNDFEPTSKSHISLSHDLLEEAEPTRIHGINDGSATPKNMSVSRFRDAVSSGGFTDAALSDLMVEIFSAACRSGNFIPGEEPLLGTYTCRFSGVDLSTRSHAAESAHAAHAKLLIQAAKDAFEQHLQALDLPCAYHTQGPLQKTNPKLCGFNLFKTRRDQMLHVFQHTLVMHEKNHAVGNIPQGEWHCYHNGCAILKPPTTSTAKMTLSTSSAFASEKEYLRHVYYEHRLSPLSISSVSWCGICEQFLEWEQFGSKEDDHFATHWMEVWSLVEVHGFCGQFDGGRRTIPPFCPFCLYNETLSPASRISAAMNQVDRGSFNDHVAAHLDALDVSSTYLCPCFPTTCRHQQEMSPQELAVHLTTIHGIVVPKTTRKKRRELKKAARALDEVSGNAEGGPGTAKSFKKAKKRGP
jgi:hypothetical protein